MKCKCDYCKLGNCECLNKCEAENIIRAYDDNGWCYWGDDKAKQNGIKIKICEDCRDAMSSESESIE